MKKFLCEGVEIKIYFLCLFLIFLPVDSSAEEIFSAGGTFDVGKGYINVPTTVWNPESNELHPSKLPFKVPDGKTLLITDLYLETDPFDGYPFLMVLAGDLGGGIQTLRTIHLRDPRAEFQSFSTPLPIESGVTVHVIMMNSIPANQSVNWSITGRVVDAVTIVRNEKAGPATFTPYPYPPVTVQDGMRIIPAAEVTSDFVADPTSGALAKVNKVDGKLVFDRTMPDRVVPVWVADAGTYGSTIVDEEAPDCRSFNEVLLLGTDVGRFAVVGCISGNVSLRGTLDLKPGQRLQYLIHNRTDLPQP